jgi:hypothetical protein
VFLKECRWHGCCGFRDKRISFPLAKKAKKKIFRVRKKYKQRYRDIYKDRKRDGGREKKFYVLSDMITYNEF